MLHNLKWKASKSVAGILVLAILLSLIPTGAKADDDVGYTLTVDVGDNGSVTIENSSSTKEIEGEKKEEIPVTSGEGITITVQANEGYSVNTFMVGGTEKELNSSGKYQLEDVNGDTTIAVKFEKKCNKYEIKTDSDQNGEISCDDNEVKEGENITVTITPKMDYNVASVKVNGVNMTSNLALSADLKSYTLEIENIQESQEIKVTYEKIVSCMENITINDVLKTATLFEGEYVYNDSVKFETTEGYSKIRLINAKGEIIETPVTKTVDIAAIQEYKASETKWYSVDLDDKESVQILIDTAAPNVNADSELAWSKAEEVDVSVSIEDTDTADNPSSKLSYYVWSEKELEKSAVLGIKEDAENRSSIKGTEASDAITIARDESQGDYTKTYYIYAVDRAQNVSVAKAVTVKFDVTAPEITGFDYFGDKKGSTQDGIAFGTDSVVSANPIFLRVMANDGEGSGAKSVALYRGDKQLDNQSFDENGVAWFTLSQTDFASPTEISIRDITDKVGNKTRTETGKKPTELNPDKIKSDRVQVNNTEPTVTITPSKASYTDAQNNLWYNLADAKDIYFTVNADGGGVNIASVKVTLNDDSILEEESQSTTKSSYTAKPSNQNWINDRNKVKAKVTSQNKIPTETEQEFFVDQTRPTVSEFKTEQSESIKDKILNHLSFGTYSNGKVTVKIKADDSEGSGVKSVVLNYKDADGKDQSKVCTLKDGYYQFTLPESEIGENDEKIYLNADLSVTATDNVGNATTVTPELENKHLMIETKKPSATVTYDAAVSDMNTLTKKSGDWYASNTEFSIQTKDLESGLNKVSININDAEPVLQSRSYEAGAEVETSDIFTINTSSAQIDKSGSYKLDISVTDNAGNQYTESRKVYKDTSKPYITGFDFDASDYVEGSEEETYVEQTDYGFYFKKDTKVTVSAKDATPTSGIKSITYYLVDKDSGKGEEKTVNVNKSNEISFEVKANFKGQIYAKATDNVGNTRDAFVTPDSAILESKAKHEEETHIELTRKETKNTTSSGDDLYRANVPVTVTVKDTYSGIRKIEWSVEAPFDKDNNQTGEVSVENDKSLTSSNDSGWKKVHTENNLVTEMKKTITVKNNSNDIVISVKMTDRAGNVSKEKTTLSIDKTNPVIEISYDNNNPDENNDKIYKENRTATIKITERNFKKKDVKYTVENTEKDIPTLSDWEKHVNEQKPDETYYTATMLYDQDGDYTFDISYTDRAGNAAKKMKTQEFTIDKTIPTLEVSYDNMDATNGNYYKSDRIATITIKEHNFDASRVKVTGKATDNGAETVFPSISGWTDSGDTHTATITYDMDGKYSFSIAYTDMAGNQTDHFEKQEFYVDKTKPLITISGVENQSANNDVVAPMVEFIDTNYNQDDVSIELTGANNGDVQYTSSKEAVENGTQVQYADFEKKQEIDDIYTLKAIAVDKAGNKTTKQIVFSVNRFGSVYTFDDYLKSVEGKYVNEEQDVIFTETNVDRLKQDKIKIKMVKNGTPTDLEEGSDYSINVSGGDGEWSQYRYVINKSLFAGDGRYEVMVYSKDLAGNENENVEESKKAEISFGIDKTAPVIVPVDLEDGTQYAEESKNAEVEIKDNLVLKDVNIYLNDKEVTYENEDDLYRFTIPEASKKQTVKIVASDAAGNEYVLPISDFLVSTNLFVRWYNNTILFASSIVSVGVLAIAITAFLLFGKRRKEEEQEQ